MVPALRGAHHPMGATVFNWLDRKLARPRLAAMLALVFLMPAALVPAARHADAAEPLPAPRGDVLLTVSGAIGRGNAQGAGGRLEARFDRAMLEQIGVSEVVTATPWHTGSVRFEGVPLKALLALVEARGTNLFAIAHNDYTATLPISDATRYNVILATKANGELLTLRDKGPLFIIYPFDSDKALQTDIVYIRSVWQLRRLDVR
jgi:hypothetical protein